MTEDFYFSSVAMKDLAEIYGVVENNIRLTLEALRDKDKVKATQALVHEDLIDELEERFRKSHIERLEEGSCSASVGVIYLDILSNFERIGDHCNNIATMVKEDF